MEHSLWVPSDAGAQTWTQSNFGTHPLVPPYHRAQPEVPSNLKALPMALHKQRIQPWAPSGQEAQPEMSSTMSNHRAQPEAAPWPQSIGSDFTQLETLTANPTAHRCCQLTHQVPQAAGDLWTAWQGIQNNPLKEFQWTIRIHGQLKLRNA